LDSIRIEHCWLASKQYLFKKNKQIYVSERINNQIRASELRVIGDAGENLGVLPFKEALALAQERGLDLIEVSPGANPPVAKIADYGKYHYEQNKKAKKAKAGVKTSETKSIQVKVGTGDHDLELKAKTASKWLAEGHRIKVELYLAGRTKYMAENFLKERLDRVLNLITEQFKIAEPLKKGPKGMMLTIERDTKKKDD
jgi:translation initiation factor IF-3